MNQNNHQTSWMFILAGIARQLIALGLGLFIGALGEAFSWNRQENFLLYLCLLCPLLLGISVALLVGVRNRHPWLNILGAGSLAWIGFYLTFIVIAFHLHPYQSPQPDLSASDPSCSPCFSGDMFVEIFIGEFFPVGLAFVAISALATGWILHTSRRMRRNPDLPGNTFQEFSPNPRTSLAFPLLRNMPFLLQILVLLLSSLILALSITNSGRLFISIVRMSYFYSILLLPLLQGLLLASSTLLCGMLFGSWRGTFVCFLALGGNLLISSLQSHRLGHSLMPVNGDEKWRHENRYWKSRLIGCPRSLRKLPEFGQPACEFCPHLLAGACLLFGREPEIAQIERDHQQIANRF